MAKKKAKAKKKVKTKAKAKAKAKVPKKKAAKKVPIADQVTNCETITEPQKTAGMDYEESNEDELEDTFAGDDEDFEDEDFDDDIGHKDLGEY